MKPEQEDMAKELPYSGGGSLEDYHIALNELCYACSDCYGNTYYAFQISLAFQAASNPEQARPSILDIYQVARARDLRILHETFNRLASFPNIDDVAVPIGAVHAAHMNTPEGIVALGAMLKSYYIEGPMVERVGKTVHHLQTRDDYISQWNALFNPTPIRSEEYQDASALPQNTTYPNYPEGVEFY